MSRFHIGQKIICVYQYKWAPIRFRRVTFPVKYGIYTVRAHCPFAEGPAVLLAEIHNSPVHFATGGIGEPSFGENFFRPLQDLKALFNLEVKEPA